LRTRLVELACLDLGERLVVVRSRPARSNAAREPHEIPGEQGRRAAALCGRGGLDAGWDKCAIARLCSSAPACYPVRRLASRERWRLERFARHADEIEPSSLSRDVAPFDLINFDGVAAERVREI